MAYRVFTVPLLQPEQSTTELNQFLATHQVLEVERQFYCLGTQAYWSFCVCFVPAKTQDNSGSRKPPYGKIDYKDVLSEEDFAVFARLRPASAGTGLLFSV